MMGKEVMMELKRVRASCQRRPSAAKAGLQREQKRHE
jgi:hypothetical protein